MEIHAKFDISDRVYEIASTRTTTFIKCNTCDGTGTVTIKKHKLTCPKCRGRKGETVYGDSAWQVTRILTIGQVIVKVTIGEDEPEQEEGYMCIETGINSGNVYDGAELFESKEAAQAECDKRNKKEAGNENTSA